VSVHSLSAPRFSPFAAAAFAGWLGVTAVWWALAFAPLPVPGAWLAAARAVCFGTLPNGLPDTWGWMLLVLGPASMLAFLLAVWGREVGSSGRWLARRPGGLVALAVAVAAASGSLAWIGKRVVAASAVEGATVPVAREALPEGYPRGFDAAPALGLVDQAGAELAVADLGGRPALVTFAYGHCATMCPTLVTTLHRAVGSFPAETAPTVVVVTLDPWRDTPGSLPSIVSGWGLDRMPRSHVLSGEVARVETVRENWGVPAERDTSTGEITHPGLIFVLDRDGRLAYRFLNPPAEWVVEAVARLGREPA
jgi:protein SCO1/2